MASLGETTVPDLWDQPDASIGSAPRFDAPPTISGDDLTRRPAAIQATNPPFVPLLVSVIATVVAVAVFALRSTTWHIVGYVCASFIAILAMGAFWAADN